MMKRNPTTGRSDGSRSPATRKIILNPGDQVVQTTSSAVTDATASMNPLLDFATVRQAHGISMDAIAEAAQVRPLHEYLFEQGRPIDSAMQGRIVHALSLLCGHHYSIKDFKQCVRPSTAERVER